MAAGDKVGYKTAKEIIHYFKNILGINKDMQKYVQSIIKTFSERMDAQGEALFKSLEGALATVSTADQWLADPQFKSETILALENLNKFSDDPETKIMLQLAKDILQSVRDGLGRNDGEFMINLSGALKTAADFNGIVTIIREYLTPTSMAYFGIASPITAKILTHIVHHYLKNSNDPASSKVSEELNVLRTQLNVQLEIARQMAGMFLIGRTQINLQRQILRELSPNGSVELENTDILDQMERTSKQYLEYIAPFSPALLKITHSIQLRIEREMEADRSLLEINPADLLDRINCFTHGDILLEGLYENVLTANLLSNRSSLTWGYLRRIYEQQDKLVIVQRKLTNQIKDGISQLFDIITKTQIDIPLSLWQTLAFVYSNEIVEENHFQLYFPAIFSELSAFHHHYHQALNETHVKNLLRAVNYTGLNEDNALFDILVNLLRKRAFFEVSHQLFCSLRFPNNILREVKIGALDVYNTVRHPIDTIVNIAYVPYLLLRHPIQTPTQIGAFFWHRPMRALTSTAINGAIVGGGTNLISKLSTTTGVASSTETLASFNSLSAMEFGGKSIYAGTLTPETYAMIHGNTLKNLATTASVIDSPLSTTVLARTSAITGATLANLPKNDSKKKEEHSEPGKRRALITKIFQDEDRRLMAMNAQTFFKTIDQVILDNENEVKDILSYCKS